MYFYHVEIQVLPNGYLYFKWYRSCTYDGKRQVLIWEKFVQIHPRTLRIIYLMIDSNGINQSTFLYLNICTRTSYALFEEPNSRILPITVSLIASRPGLKNLRGSYTLESVLNTSRTTFVNEI